MLEDLPERQIGNVDLPRASLVLAIGALPGLQGNVWMGGAHSLAGEQIRLSGLQRSAVIDCAGDMPLEYREAAGLWLSNVFHDVDAWPMHFDRIEANVARAAQALRSAPAITDVYAMCTHGMNRRGLVACLLLRSLCVLGS
ncbi:MAG: hypothetical protein ACRDG3_12890 [Tepidiformaceae bacterium]